MTAVFAPNNYNFFPLGTDALTVEFGNAISVELNEKAVRLAKYFEENRFAGFIETVPAYASVTVFYDPSQVRRNFPEFTTAFEAVRKLAENALQNLSKSTLTEPQFVEIPVDFSAAVALDLDFVAAHSDLSTAEVIEIFTAAVYRVFMLGFLPAFAYMGEVSEKIAAPRKSAPRLVVPQGSVGIAGRQTGIYPFDSPGGWQIIGRTGFQLFTPLETNPCALAAGDLVKFYALNR
ncbi:MAG TPA: 5-oxoprolinase subunit PxpB [Pyrinomonadaceae bacterium]